MKVMPWHRRESLLPSMPDFESFWNSIWEKEDEGFKSHLPEVFRARLFPAVNIAETEENFCITMDCPGLEEKDFEIQTMGNQLLISGERKWEEEKKGKEFRRVESQFGKFERTVRLPENAKTDPSVVDASYKKGILTITIPKLEKTPASKISVHAG